MALLELRALEKTYGKDTRALNGVNLTFEHGEFVVIIGPSGAGKSTLIRCINKMVELSGGEVIICGEHVERLRGRALRKMRSRIGMIFQHYNLVGRVNVIKNVLHGRLGKTSTLKSLLGLYPVADKQAAFDLLHKVGLEEQIYKRADELSGGQMQRVGICRALIQQPELLLADEPIASLDPQSAEVVMEQLKSITAEQGLTCIVNLHQVDFARRYATRIVGIKAGVVVFDGVPDELTDETIAAIYKGKEHEMRLTTAVAPIDGGIYA